MSKFLLHNFCFIFGAHRLDVQLWFCDFSFVIKANLLASHQLAVVDSYAIVLCGGRFFKAVR